MEVGRGARVNRAIIDKNVRLAEGSTLGIEDGDSVGYHTSESGIIVVEKAPRLEAGIGTISI